MNGLNDFAGNVEMRVGLREAFPPRMILQIKKQNHTEDYVNHAAVTDRLNAEAPGWTNGQPEFLWADGHIVGVVCSMTIGSVTRWEVGDADGRSNPGDEAKKAMSDWLKRAAMRFGVGIDLWIKGDPENPVAPRSKWQSSAPMSSRVADGGESTDRPGTAVARPATAAGSPDTSGLPPDRGTAPADEPYGEGGTTAGAVPHYLSKEDQALLKVEYGSQAKALLAYKRRFGERINNLGDITYEMRDELSAQVIIPVGSDGR